MANKMKKVAKPGIKYNRKNRVSDTSASTKFDPALKEVILYTDGSCLRNPSGPGGIGAIVRFGKHVKAVQEGYRSTTNNRMEMLAALRGLDLLNQKCNVTIYTDSQYLVNGMTSWVKGWQKRGWKLANGERVKNVDLWMELLSAASAHRVRWEWVKGHNGNPDNELCDMMARSAAESPTLVDQMYETFISNDR